MQPQGDPLSTVPFPHMPSMPHNRPIKSRQSTKQMGGTRYAWRGRSKLYSKSLVGGIAATSKRMKRQKAAHASRQMSMT